MEEINFKKIITIVIVFLLAFLSFLVLKPLLLSIVFGIFLAYVLSPVYNLTYKATKSKNFSATFICVFFVVIVVLILWLLTPLLINQAIKLYLSSQQIDFITPIKAIFPSLSSSQLFLSEAASIFSSFIVKSTDSIVTYVTNILFDLPTISLQLVVVLFVLFFALRDKDDIINLIRSILPFSEATNKRVFDYAKGITSSVIYGEIVVGLLQGIIIGIAFFIFKVPNPLLYTVLAIIAGVLPIIGTAIVWVPVLIYLIIQGDTSAIIGILAFGLVSSHIDNILKPMIISKRVKIPSSIVLIGMIGGVLLFGVLGVILGPLILAYFLIAIESYLGKPPLPEK
jgi:predicted PurR-regulated permease PerM